MKDLTEAAAEKMFANTYTKADGYARLLLLQDFFDQHLYDAGATSEDLVREIRERDLPAADREHAAAIAEWGGEVLVALLEKDSRAHLAELKRRISAAPEMVLYVPIRFSSESLRVIGAWCRTEVQPNVLLDVRVDPAVAGGCSLVWKNTLHDFSLDYFMRKHEKELVAKIDSYVSPGV